jgi:uncharacterized RmlC-like cupin family protein/alpha-beta hydrolase superfamily lysophospholipase
MTHETPTDEVSHERRSLQHVPADRLDRNTAQTSEMVRREAISHKTVGSTKLWMGETSVSALARSGPHHHGDSETAIYVVTGHPEFGFLQGEGDQAREVQLKTKPGDYVYVPPFVPHWEGNPDSGEDAVVVIARTTQEAIVINLPSLSMARVAQEAPSHIGAGRRWDPAAIVSPRGTVFVVPGRGEHSNVYERLGLRLAFDGYVVHAMPRGLEDETGQRDDLDSLESAVADASRGGDTPLVLIGSDTGALAALALASRGRLPVDGVVVAGLPVGTGPSRGYSDWAHELELRTACPVHRKRITDDDAFRRGALRMLPHHAGLADVAASTPAQVPILAIHGTSDKVGRLKDVRSWLAAFPRVRLVKVNGGLHDILNDVQHRSVAAEVVSFLERVRQGPEFAPIVVGKNLRP